MKARLYSSSSGWNGRHDSIMSHFGLPDGGTKKYAEISQVDKEGHSDFGKYVFPVAVSGQYKCDQLFSSGLVDWDDDWFAQEAPE